MTKRIISVFITFCMLLTFASCKNPTEEESDVSTTRSSGTAGATEASNTSQTSEPSASVSPTDTSETTCEPVPTVTETVPETVAATVITVAPTEVFQGEYLTVFISNSGESDKIEYDTKLAANWMIKTIPHEGGFLALIPIEWDKAPADYNLGIKVTRDGETAAETSEMVKVSKKDFEKHYIVVSEELAATRSDENFAKDGVYTSRARSATSSEPLWEGSFILPVEGARITCDYGLIRYVNNVVVGRHSGLDVSIAAGAPVMASNGGRVTLAMELIVTGNTIIIDHGMNIFTAYCHLSKMFVEQGDIVAKYDVIGEVGSTGFSTGPHLHWTFTIGETFVNPWLFMDKDPLDWLAPTE
ncbi:MAG: M23 family metallopeptidase [Eubacteriales bacterium]|nr:M23 family metallopeptidase [Eubacteriales bacterium]